MAEGAPLLREYRVKNSIEGSNPSLSANPLMKPARPRALRVFLWVAQKPLAPPILIGPTHREVDARQAFPHGGNQAPRR